MYVSWAVMLLALVIAMMSLPDLLAAAQEISNLKPLLHVQTRWFDIYAPHELEAQAWRLSSFADNTYSKLNGFFDTQPSRHRIPVLISDIAHSLNGYSTLLPSNRIVIFLASADPRGQLASMADELESVFLHELVHCITLNERKGGWKALAWLGGDWVAPEGWMMPQALVEGTAVWAESRLSAENGAAGESRAEDGAAGRENQASAKSGRLNDPAALQIVRIEREWGQNRSLWDVSGLADFYGSGSLAYLYGGLFADYLAERFGPEILGQLWHDAAGGNIFRGFDGTALSKGILEVKTGVRPQTLWADFLSWIDSGMEKAGEVRDAVELFSGYIGAFDVGEGVVYYFDGDKRGVYARAILDGQRKGVESQGKEAESRGQGTEPRRLFAADENLRNIRFNVRFHALDIDWIRPLPDGRTIPARYQFDLETKTLSYIRDLPIPPAGAALAVAQNGSSRENIFLYDPWTDPESGTDYGLVRLGSTILPARRTAEGKTEIIDIPGYAVRWISPGFRLDSEGSAASRGIRFALTLIPENGISRLGILEEEHGSWLLLVQNQAPEGGICQPVYANVTKIVYLSSKKDGLKALNVLDIGEIDKQSTSASSLFSTIPVEWQDAVRWAQLHYLEAMQEPKQTAAIKKTDTLFPALFSSSRIPYAEGNTAGLVLTGSDLSERAAWQVFAGWDFSNWRPSESAHIQLGAGEWHVLFSVADQSVLYASLGRVSSVSAVLKWERSFVPLFRSLSADLHGIFAGFQDAYPLAEVFQLSPDSTSWAIGLDAQYQSLYRSRKPPYDQYGFALAAGADYEVASRSGFGGMSLGGSITVPGRVGLSAYGAYAPFGGVAFSPALRLLASGSSIMPSAVQAPYPSYREYSSLISLSNWYTFGEVDVRLFSIEAGWMLRMPLSPSWALRRIIGRAGVRGAGLEIDSTPSALCSAFARVEFDLAILAGMVATSHTMFSVEAAWAFMAQKVGGSPLHINIGINAEL
jgi:hypothetical protein